MSFDAHGTRATAEPVRTSARRLLPLLAAAVLAVAALGVAAGLPTLMRNTGTSPAKVIIGAFDLGPSGFREGFNPFQATAGHFVFGFYLSTLIKYCDVSLTTLCGDLAEHWDVSPDGKTYTFTLRDAKWHDGTPVTADDLDFTYHLQLNKTVSRFSVAFIEVIGVAAVLQGAATRVTGFEVLGPKTFRMTLVRPVSAITSALALIPIVQRKQWAGMNPEDILKSDVWHNGVIGSGPFIFSKYVPGEYVEYLPFADYYGGKPKIDKLVNRYFDDPDVALIALQNGEIDFTYVSLEQREALLSNPAIRVIRGPSLNTQAIYFNRRIAAFKDRRVRQAVMYAIDREALVQSLWKNEARVGMCFYSPFGPLNAPDANPYAYDPARARTLLSEAGVDPAALGELELLTATNDRTTQDVLVVVKEQLGAIGIKIRVRVADTPTMLNAILTADPQWGLLWASAGSGPEPDDAYVTFHSSAKWPNGFNFDGIENADLDRALDAARVERDPDKRAEYFRQACRIMNEDVVRAWMFEGARFGAISVRVEDFIYTPAPGGARYFSHPEKWVKK